MTKIRIQHLIKKLTILDWLVLFVIVISLGVGLIHYSREKSTIYVFTINDFPDWQRNPIPPLYWVSNSISVGDEAFDSTGRKIAEVVEVDNTEWGGQRRYSRLKLEVTALRDRRTKQYRIGDNTLQVGSDLILDIGNTKYRGLISYVGDSLEPPEDQSEFFEVEILASEVLPWLAETYDETFVMKNTQGGEVFKIIDSLTVPAEKSVEAANGSIIRSKDPYFKDVYITALIKARCQENVCYFNETTPVKVGQWIWAQTEKSFIEGSARIIDVKQLQDGSAN